MSVAVGGSAVAEENGNLVQGFRREAPEIEAHVGVLGIVGGIAFLAVDKVGELYWIFDEENRRVVAYHVVVTFFSVVLDCKATRITVAVVGATLTCYCREAEKDWSLFSDLVHKLGLAKTKLKRSKGYNLTV